MTPNAQTDAFLAGAHIGLATLDAREARPRRFGPEAEARWERFVRSTQSALGPLHRIVLLLRDAAAVWPAAFAPAVVFALPGLASDEPFGPFSLPPMTAAQREALVAPAAEAPTFAAAAARWGRALQPIALPTLGPASRLALAGPSAFAAAAAAFAHRPDLDWARQVRLVATFPAARQLAGLASIFAGSAGPTVRIDQPHHPK